jgi:hypothetical protein
MASKDGLSFNVKLDSRALKYFKKYAPQKLQEARKVAVETAGMIWADSTKDLTTEENHIDTSLYVNSIGYATGEPADPIYEVQQSLNKTKLKIGADVAYASHLERRYGLMARGLDRAKPRISANVWRQVRKSLDL